MSTVPAVRFRAKGEPLICGGKPYFCRHDVEGVCLLVAGVDIVTTVEEAETGRLGVLVGSTKGDLTEEQMQEVRRGLEEIRTVGTSIVLGKLWVGREIE